jgi:hypothetical protein
MTCQTAVSLGVYVLGRRIPPNAFASRPICPAARHAAPNWPAWRRLPGLLARVPPDLRRPRPALRFQPGCFQPGCAAVAARPAFAAAVPAGARPGTLAAAVPGCPPRAVPAVPAALGRGPGRRCGSGGRPRRRLPARPPWRRQPAGRPGHDGVGRQPGGPRPRRRGADRDLVGTSIRLRSAGSRSTSSAGWSSLPVGPERGGRRVGRLEPGPSHRSRQRGVAAVRHCQPSGEDRHQEPGHDRGRTAVAGREPIPPMAHGRAPAAAAP